MSKRPNYRRIAHKRWTKNSTLNIIISLVVIVLLAVVVPEVQKKMNNSGDEAKMQLTNQDVKHQTELAALEYSGQQTIQINNNNPGFTEDELSLAKGTWQQYGDLDRLNRVTIAKAMLGQDLMPKSERERLYVDPTGYHNKKVAMNGHMDWLYNRSHLIGYQLTGQNNNLKNLMTGTRSLNDPGMTKYENQIAEYIRTTNHHVLYYVQPIFRGDELVARGISMRAQSVEDSTIKFNIYIFNVQEGVSINYADGTSRKV
ncbi:hypothetical protein FC62_GL000541 [Amylolactobacillus amylotrophicus DSM 20534]|uniref:Uncharacterized protein n=3 Tax=Amylolactobacillus TaxID=2767876 RepID=A0A1L6XD75_9LACO|nr:MULTISPECIES: DNA/RNA non-specific endonuclease [Amylolactobacillus]APT18895.1 hypothetical protein LA20533_06380 [Amylolactobacillus amylophilus DSM 20533 = JCM 1125]KRK38849.1 hypothetical protein FC62_GL000541 [Amylolactobacillus amylotrophicus DSM 20534]KRM42508.1 hypothetical protein FD40_GL000299 [Amylolactobacillus amylophilus DSM 20533 = JCM 1125]GED80072.1 hypothetical protein LAM01_05450 [Amylolactobacillus amylophilus]